MYTHTRAAEAEGELPGCRTRAACRPKLVLVPQYPCAQHVGVCQTGTMRERVRVCVCVFVCENTPRVPPDR